MHALEGVCWASSSLITPKNETHGIHQRYPPRSLSTGARQGGKTFKPNLAREFAKPRAHDSRFLGKQCTKPINKNIYTYIQQFIYIYICIHIYIYTHTPKP